MTGKYLRKIIKQLLLMFCILKKKKYSLLTFPNMAQPTKKIIFLKIPNKKRRLILSYNKSILCIITQNTFNKFKVIFSA